MNQKPLVFSLATLALAVALPVSALAEDVAPLVSEATLAAAERDFTWEVRLDAEAHSSDNASFRALDESRGDQERRETDDRHTFGLTRLGSKLSYKLADEVTFRFAGSHSGLWGSNQLGGGDLVGGFFLVSDLSVNWRAIDNNAFKFDVRVGRLPFSIGGAERDYFFSDAIDGLVFEATLPGPAGKVRILGLDIASAAGRPDSINIGNWPTVERKLVQNMRGDTNTMRFGAVYENTSLLDGLELRGFGFYSSVGAGGTGSDRTHNGTLANFSDNDFNWIGGTRLGYFFKFGASKVGGYGEYARAGGIDRKDTNIGYHDVVVEGNAFGAALVGNFLFDSLLLDSTLQFFQADGPRYGADGLMFSHGFVGFKGSYAGGLNMGRYAGWRPAAYLGRGGVHQAAHDRRRESGTQMVHFGLGFGLVDTLKLDLGAWHYVDTGNTNLDLERASTLGDALPAGSSQDDLEAQARLGKTLGTELNARLSYSVNQSLSFFTSGGIFVPGEFYSVEVTRKVGSSRGGDDLQDFWAISAGTSLTF